MRKQIIENAAFDVATQVRSVEDAIDGVLAEIAELQSKMVHAVPVLGLGTAKSNQPFVELASALQALVGARVAMGDCHVALVEAKQFVPGLRTVGWGDGEECPPSKGAADLRVVA
jgi:hypothetical protein